MKKSKRGNLKNPIISKQEKKLFRVLQNMSIKQYREAVSYQNEVTEFDKLDIHKKLASMYWLGYENALESKKNKTI